MDRISQRDWLKTLDADGASEIDTKTLLADGTIVVCVCAKGDRGVPAHRSRRVSPSEIFTDGRPAAFAIEDDGTVSLLLGEGRPPRFVPRVKSVHMERPTTIHIAKWLEDYKGVNNSAYGNGSDFRICETRLVGFRIADDNTVCRVLVDERHPWGWDRASYDGEHHTHSLTGVIDFLYGIHLQCPCGGRWGRGRDGGRDTAYFNEHGDVVFDADPRIWRVYRDYLDDYFKVGDRHPVVSF